MKIPSLETVREYFLNCNFYDAPNQAQVFYDYNISIGWKVGNKKAPMVDWQAAARNWNRNAIKFAKEKGVKIGRQNVTMIQGAKKEPKVLPSLEEVEKIL